jgi:quinol monooxygenase YgiN
MIEIKSRETPTRIVFSTYYRVHPEDRQKFIDAVLPHISYTAAQPGCVYYVFASDLEDPNTFHLSEGWENQAALDRHDDSELFKKALHDVVTGVRVLDTQGQRYDVAGQGPSTPPGGIEGRSNAG